MTEGPLFPLGGSQSNDRPAATDHPHMSPSSYPMVGPPPSAIASQSGADTTTRKVAIVAATVVAITGIAAAAYVFTSRSTNSTPSMTPRSPAAASAGSQSITSRQGTPVAPAPAPAPQLITATVVGTCDEGGSCGVKQRTAPFTAAPRMFQNDLFDGSVIVLTCRTAGDVRASAGHGSSSVWYRLDNGAYVNSVYLDADSRFVPSC